MPFPLPQTSPAKKYLILSFDAFGTLFHPRKPIATQYIEVARQLGVEGDYGDEGRFMESFKRAFKETSRLFPNYGSAVRMSPESWWGQIITKTFSPFLPRQPSQSETSQPAVPEPLISALIQQFSTEKGYTLYPDVLPLFRRLRSYTSTPSNNDHLFAPYTSVAIGIITNSDRRVKSILEHLGITVAEPETNPLHTPTKPPKDISFITLSYDAGAEKPDPRIFEEAKRTALRLHGWEEGETDFVHVGDDLVKDVLGAQRAGWRSILLDREGANGEGARAVDEGGGGLERLVIGMDVVRDLGGLGRGGI